MTTPTNVPNLPSAIKFLYFLITTVMMFAAIFGYASNAGLPEDCPTEDSFNCVWIASERGNGNGRSFIVGPASADGETPEWTLFLTPEGWVAE